MQNPRDVKASLIGPIPRTPEKMSARTRPRRAATEKLKALSLTWMFSARGWHARCSCSKAGSAGGSYGWAGAGVLHGKSYKNKIVNLLINPGVRGLPLGVVCCNSMSILARNKKRKKLPVAPAGEDTYQSMFWISLAQTHSQTLLLTTLLSPGAKFPPLLPSSRLLLLQNVPRAMLRKTAPVPVRAGWPPAWHYQRSRAKRA